MLSIKETAEALGVGRETVRKMIVSGELPAVQVLCPGGKSYRVDLDLARRALETKLGAAAAVARLVVAEAAEPEATVAEVANIAATVAEGTLAELSLRALVAEQERTRNLEQALAAERAEKAYAQQERERIQRQVDNLSLELNKYRFALEEQAESLNEERTLRLASEARENEIKGSIVQSSAHPSGWNRFRKWFGLGGQATG